LGGIRGSFLGRSAHDDSPKELKLGGMETFLPTFEGPLRRAYPFGTYGHPGLSSTSSCLQLLLREHALTSLYWFPEERPLGQSLFQRVDDVLPTKTGRRSYVKHYRFLGQQLSQARMEGMAIAKRDRDYIMPDEEIIPPPYYYPSVALDFLSEHYLPGAALRIQSQEQKESLGQVQRFYDRAAARAREAACLLGVYLEYTHHAEVLESCCLFDRMIFTLFALNPVLRLGMPSAFGDFIRRSMVSMAQYVFEQKEMILSCMSEVPPLYYDDLAECLAELANLMMQIGPYRPLEDNGFETA